jgi:hypothetical protein
MTVVVGIGVFVLTLLSGFGGLWLHRRLLDHHRSDESKDVVRLVQALIASMATLVLGLLIASASSHYRTQADGVTALAADIMVLDGALAHVGPDAQEARAALRGMLAAAIAAHVLEAGAEAAVVDPASMDAFYNAIAGLRTTSPAQQFAQRQALAIASRLVQARAMLLVRDVTDQVQWPFLAVLVSWLAMLFLAMGLFVRANSVIHAALIAGALAVGGAVFLILELEQSRSGLLRISEEPLRFVLRRIGG